MAYAGHAGKWVTPVGIPKTNIDVFKGCMYVTNGRVVLSCASTAAVCLLTVIPGHNRLRYYCCVNQ